MAEMNDGDNRPMRVTDNAFLTSYLSRLMHDSFCLSSNSFMTPLVAGNVLSGQDSYMIMLFYRDVFEPDVNSIFAYNENVVRDFERDISKALNEQYLTFVAEVDGFTVALITLTSGVMKRSGLTEEDVLDKCVSAASKVVEHFEQRYLLKFRCLYSGFLTAINWMYMAYDKLYQTWAFRKYFQGTLTFDKFTHIGATPDDVDEDVENYCREASRKLCGLIIEGNREETLSFAAEMLETVVFHTPQAFDNMRIRLQCLSTNLRVSLTSANINIPDEMKNQITGIMRAVNYSALEQCFEGFIESIYDLYHEKVGSLDITGIIRYIDENIRQPWLSVQAVSDSFGLNLSVMSTQFKARMGQRPIDYIHNRRLELAIKLLTTTDLSIKDVCTQAGYGSVTTMNRAFKNYMSVTPSWYRNKAGTVNT